MELDIWSGDWGLPSTDFKCLQILTLLKTSGVTFQTNKTNYPFFVSNGLPVFRHGKEKLHSFNHILSYLEQKNHALDPNLSAKELGESLAYRSLVEEKLFPALRYIWWVDEKNFESVTRPLYVKKLPLPFNFFYPGQQRRLSEEVIHSLYQHLENDADIQVEVFKEAEKCLTCLSNRLDNKEFFFGSHPCSLDSFVYGCLAPLLKAPFPSNVLQNHLKACPNLVKFVARITQRYFSRELQEYNKQHPKKDNEAAKSDILPNKVRNQILAAVFAVSAMLTYGIYCGIFSISLNNVELDETDDFVNDEQFSD